MKLYFAAFLKGQRLMNKDPAKSLYPIDDVVVVKIQSLMTFLRSCSCCNDKKKKKDRCGSCVALGEWTHIPSGMVMKYHGNGEWSTNLGKYRGEINGDTVPSFYVDGGTRNYKKEPGVRFTIRAGTVIYIRPAVSKREDERMHNLEFRAVEVIDVDAGIIVPPPSPSSSSVVSFEFDDEIHNNNNANTLVVVKQEARNDDVPTVVDGTLALDIDFIFGTITMNSSSKNNNNDDDNDDDDDDDDDDDGDLMSFTPRGLDPPCSPPRNNIWVFN